LLGVVGEGRLTDVPARRLPHALIVMTTNLGAGDPTPPGSSDPIAPITSALSGSSSGPSCSADLGIRSRRFVRRLGRVS
jgi:hypothetical protein